VTKGRHLEQRRGVWLGMGLVTGLLAGLTWLHRERARRSSPLLRRAEVQSGKSLTALVTGASSGIGQAYATKLAAMGYNLILVARRKDRLDSLASDLTDIYGVRVSVVPVDLATDAGIAAVEQAIASTDDLGILVNNAGFGMYGPFARGDINRHLDMIRLHVLAVVRLTRAALPGMLARRRGIVINVSSLIAFYPIYGSTTYTATKCYLRSFTEALHQELAGTGVRAQSLCPGFVRTEFQECADIQSLAIPDGLCMSAQDVVAGSLRDLAADRPISVPGPVYRFLATLSAVLPRPVIYLAGRVIARQRGK